MLRLLKNNLARVLFAGLVLNLVFMVGFSSKVFADRESFTFGLVDPDYIVYLEDGTITGKLGFFVNEAGKYTSVFGTFAVDTSDFSSECKQYTNITSITPGSGIPADATVDLNLAAGTYSITRNEGMDLSVGDELFRIAYRTSTDAPDGIYCGIEFYRNYTKLVDGNVEEYIEPASAASIWDTFRSPQYLSYDNREDNRVYGGPAAGRILTTTLVYGLISYSSSDENIATVTNRGVVHIVGTGTVTITATAARAYQYAESSASYTINIAPKPISITSVSVPDKNYDGTADSEVDVVTLDDPDLVQGVDYTATAVFDNADPGEDKTVTVTVTLLGKAASNYKLTSNTFEISGVAIHSSGVPSKKTSPTPLVAVVEEDPVDEVKTVTNDVPEDDDELIVVPDTDNETTTGSNEITTPSQTGIGIEVVIAIIVVLILLILMLFFGKKFIKL